MALLLSTRRTMVGAVSTYADKVLSYGPVAYWPLSEASGTAATCLTNPAMNGTYSSDVSGWPVGTGIGDGNTAPGFDGTNDYIDIYSVPFRDAFDGGEGTVHGWFRVSAVGDWTDGIQRLVVRLYIDANNYISIYKSNANNTFGFEYKAGGTLEFQLTAGMTATTAIPLALTWSATADAVIYYLNGTTSGAADAGLGVWAGQLAALTTLIGAGNQVPVNSWKGAIGHVSVFDRPLSASDIADLAVV